MYKHILFDLDGTLTDPYEGITRSVQHALRRSGIEPPCQQELLPFIGPPLGTSFAEFFGMSKQGCADAVVFYREHFSTKGVFENELVPGVPAMLQQLRQAGCTLYIATSKPTIYANQILEYFGILEHFTYVEGSPLDDQGTEKPIIVRRVLERFGIPKRQAVMVGDRRFDMEGAKENGIPGIGVLFVPYANRQELEESGASAVAATVHELTALLLTP